MKTNLSSLSYLKWFSLPVLAFVVIAIPLNLYFEPISGELTRIGHWSERDFGWQQPQPTVAVHANGTSITNPDVVVLGDSFTHPNIWQSYLAESRNLNVLSFQYQDVACVDNWLHWVAERRYPNLHTVVIETVERGFVPLFRNFNNCPRRTPKSFQLAENNVTPSRPQKGLTLDAGYLIPTATNTLRAAWSDGSMVSGEVINVPLSTDKLFSNRKANRLLYFADDELKRSWSDKDQAAAVANLNRFQDNLAKKGLRLVVIVVPDKSSVYRPYLSNEASKVGYPDVFEQLKTAGVTNVNLLSYFQHAAGETVDLYLPNDTHLSTQGYRLMASKVADEAF
ncbi:alginate O-acetyltransferase AlgX-related protein [Rhodoferax aquaticus]|uniref:AlgX/AlgJ SGNH hydrolase-like domain-containing protein n=1 Tax=Rhodoferax aquaticus TaxID=2527691 RepID=A0A515ERI1_9BURK|nr:hypothetical protein [Rhodoferax aquaticus]QDL55233.1 hypothetical protein EXZ61_14235 [Rhodoferax aquaticus]